MRILIDTQVLHMDDLYRVDCGQADRRKVSESLDLPDLEWVLGKVSSHGLEKKGPKPVKGRRHRRGGLALDVAGGRPDAICSVTMLL